MLLEQLYLGCMSQASYVVADEVSGRAVVVDPRRDIGEYLHVAAGRGLSIELIVLTHVHADFVPGHTELAAATGAEVAMGAEAPVDFPFRRLVDGERIPLGDPQAGVVLEVLATPGHTPESITLAVYERGGDAVPTAILTGDTLFVGDVGRPDLLGSAGHTAGEMAAKLHRSLREKILPLPDEVLVYPGHGAGSACGKALSSVTFSTLAEQRATNYALAPMSEEEFVAAVTEGLSEPPAYFSEDVALNRSGHQPFDPSDPIPMVDQSDAVERATHGALLLDVRDDQAFAAGHLRGAVNVGLSGRFAEYAAGVRAPGQEVVLFGSGEQVTEARMRLARVGVDTVVAAADSQDLGTRSDLVESSSRLEAAEARRRLEEVGALQILDVRNPAEVAEGALPGSTNIPLPRLRARLGELDPQRPALVYCAGGYRSMAAASMLEAAGFTDVSDLIGGYGAWLTSR
ncbi:MAG TPA: rhodanese-like domain-containing protein [Acidimicrobiales bacterium]|nr:rhodanese-like domain-containing protein [Acidimicrobiales bacterium]